MTEQEIYERWPGVFSGRMVRGSVALAETMIDQLEQHDAPIS